MPTGTKFQTQKSPDMSKNVKNGVLIPSTSENKPMSLVTTINKMDIVQANQSILKKEKEN
jgi:hypothetical protein